MFDWYKIFNKNEFLALGLVSRTISASLEERGTKDILVCLGNELSIKFEDVFLTVKFNDKNPFQVGSYSIYIDELSDVWLGFEVSP